MCVRYVCVCACVCSALLSGIYINTSFVSIVSNLHKTQLKLTTAYTAACRSVFSLFFLFIICRADSYNTGCSTFEYKVSALAGSDFHEPRVMFLPLILFLEYDWPECFKVFGGLVSTSKYPVALEDSSNLMRMLFH